jgi:hypothetical protein
MASVRDLETMTPSGLGGYKEEGRENASMDEETTTLRRPLNGLLDGGMDSHVSLPMTTAFRLPGEHRVVTAANSLSSLGIDHGRDPFKPMPPSSSTATSKHAFTFSIPTLAGKLTENTNR